MNILDQMKAKWEAAGRGALDERAPMLANWYLGHRHAWWEAMEMVNAAEPTRQPITREAVTAIVTDTAKAFQRNGGTCQDDPACYCRRTIDALMTLIGDAP